MDKREKMLNFIEAVEKANTTEDFELHLMGDRQDLMFHGVPSNKMCRVWCDGILKRYPCSVRNPF